MGYKNGVLNHIRSSEKVENIRLTQEIIKARIFGGLKGLKLSFSWSLISLKVTYP